MTTAAILKNTIQDYAWGSETAIAELLGIANPSKTPQAELWMGAHPKGPSLVEVNQNWTSLPDLIEENPEAVLGQRIAKKFAGKLPYLFKVLAAAKPLSIQVHPNRSQAKAGFDHENAAGLPLDAAQRNYRDDNHKPECICALTPFWALCGFRKISESIGYLKKVCPESLKTELEWLHQNRNSDGLKRFFSALMDLNAHRRRKVINETRQNAEILDTKDPVFDWMIRLLDDYPHDIGILSPTFLNLVCLEPGQALFLDSGQLHAYLDGVGIELMANSDNVLRGGLTPKHIDVPELLKVLDFNELKVEILSPQSKDPCEYIYHTSAEEFVLSSILLDGETAYKSKEQRSAEIVLCTDGNAKFIDTGSKIEIVLGKGVSILIPAAVKDYQISGHATLYKAAAPV
jgi:mannose-6-phosphate isomerase